MNTKPFIWGISKWRDFEQCPRMCRKKHVTKQWKEAPNEAMERGKKLHKALEESIKYDLALPPELAHMDGMVKQFIRMRGQGIAVYPEMKYGVSTLFKKVEFFDGDNLRVRCVLDLFVQEDPKVSPGDGLPQSPDEFGKILVVDWKSGKRKDEHEQDAEFYGAMTHLAFGGLYRTTSMYAYIDNMADTFTKPIENAHAIASNWWQKFDYADKLILVEEAPATPCNACAWCGDVTCKFNKNKKLKG